MDKDFSDMMNKFSDMMESTKKSGENSIQNGALNIDINTLLKLKSVMDSLNTNNDPKGNLLKSLRPYLKENKQAKVDQFINLFNMGKVMEIFKNTGGDNK